jgi:hypothetical protein
MIVLLQDLAHDLEAWETAPVALDWSLHRTKDFMKPQ